MARGVVSTLGWLSALIAGCSPLHELELVSVLPQPCAQANVNELRVSSVGDFQTSASDVASVGALGTIDLDLDLGTRAITVEGIGPSGLTAFGRTAPLELPDQWSASPRVAVAYGPPDAFCTTAALAYARAGHRATLLADGSVLLSGGVNRDGLAVTALERYLPTGTEDSPVATFQPAGTSIDPRAVLLHDATRLADGRVLLSGGAPAAGGVASGIAYEGAVLLDANATMDGPPRVLDGGPRAAHAGLALADGRVLLTGGCSELEDGACAIDRYLSTVTIYDPGTDAFVAGPSLLTARAGHSAVLRDDGMVMIVGGVGADGSAPSPELYDPDEARSATIAGPVGSAARTASGLVVALGDAVGTSARVVAWSGRDEAPVALVDLPSARASATITALEDGAVLVAGGWDGESLAASSAVYEGTSQTILPGFSSRGHAATRLLDGSVLLSGGFSANGQASAHATIYLRSLTGPFYTPPTLAFDGALTLVPDRPGVASIVDGALVVAATSTRPAYAVVAGPILAGPSTSGFDLALLVGKQGNGTPSILFGDPANGSYVEVVLPDGSPARLDVVAPDRPGLLSTTTQSCEANVVEEIPDAPALRALTASFRNGRIVVADGPRTLLSCDGGAAAARGLVALGAAAGTARFDDVQLMR